MLTGRIRQQVIVLSIVPLAFLVALLVIAYILERKTDDAAYWAEHSAAVLNQSDVLDKTLYKANASVIRFVTARRPSDLVGYNAAISAIPGEIRTLESMVADNPPQSARARDLASAMTQATGILHRYVTFIRAGQVPEAQALDASASTRNAAEHLTGAKAAFDRAERNLAIERFSNLRRQLGVLTGVILGLTVVAIVVTFFLAARFGLRLAERLYQLAENARRLGEGEDPPRMAGNDELADLDRVYQDMARRLRRERRVARTLQHALLPQRTPVIPGIEITAAYSPATRASDIGGDWYDAFLIGEDLLALSVGDVVGSGLRAATVMGGARQSIRTAARENANPSHVMRVANRMMCADGWLASAFYAVLNTRDGTITFSSAGHPPPFVVSPAGATAVSCTGMLLGVDDTAVFESCGTKLDDGDVLVLYTDGLIEAERDVIKGLEQLQSIVSEPQVRLAGSPARAIQHRVFEHVRASDDSAVLTVRLARPIGGENGRASWTFDARDADAARRVRAEMVRFITGHAPESDFSTAELIFSELAGNIARHTPGQARLSLERHNGTIEMRMSDVGDPFLYEDPAEIDPFEESGRGLFLVHSLARDMRIERSGIENTVTVLLAS